MGNYLEIKFGALNHHKFSQMGKALGISAAHALGNMQTLWLSVALHREDGVLDGWADDQIAHYAGWEGDGPTFVRAALAARLLDRTNDGICVHDWREHFKLDWKAHERERKRNSKRNERSRKGTSATPATSHVPFVPPRPLSQTPQAIKKRAQRARKQSAPGGHQGDKSPQCPPLQGDKSPECPPNVPLDVPQQMSPIMQPNDNAGRFDVGTNVAGDSAQEERRGEKEKEDQSSTAQVDRNIPTPQRVAKEPSVETQPSREAVDDDDSPLAMVMRAKAACDRRNADPEFIAAMKAREEAQSDAEKKPDSDIEATPERPAQGSTETPGSIRNMPSHVRNDQWARMQAAAGFKLPDDLTKPMSTADAQDWAEANGVGTKVGADMRREFDGAKVTWREFLAARQSAADRKYTYEHVAYLLRAALKDRTAPKGKPLEAHAGYMAMVREVAEEHGLLPGGPLTANALLQKGYETRAQLESAAQRCAQSMAELAHRKPSTPSPAREPTKAMISASEIVAKVMPQG